MDAALPRVAISLASPKSAGREAFVSRLVDIVNAAYAASEGGDIFVDGYQRTDSTEMIQFIEGDEIAIATASGADPEIAVSDIIGCIRIQALSETHGEFGMLALDLAFHGKGYGRDLILFAEEECRRRGKAVMQVELLFPTWVEHAAKQRLEAWYQRLGYVFSRKDSFGDSYPHLAILLRGDTEYRIYEKHLVA